MAVHNGDGSNPGYFDWCYDNTAGYLYVGSDRPEDQIYWEVPSALKNHSAFTGSELFRKTFALQTSGTSLTTVVALTDISDSAFRVTAECDANNDDDGGLEVGSYMTTCLYRNDGGTLTEVGEADHHTDLEVDAAWDMDCAPVSGNVEVRVKGNGENVNWVCTVEYRTVGDNL